MRIHIHNITNIKRWAVELLRGCLHAYYQRKPIQKILWFTPDVSTATAPQAAHDGP